MIRVMTPFLAFLGVLMVASLSAKVLPEVPAEAKRELGSTYGKGQMSGFVFIDGKYLPPPYTVTRIGNGIFINRIQVEQPVAWSRFVPQEPPKEDADSDFQEEPAEAPAPEAAPVKQSPEDELDELFGEEEAATPPQKTDAQKGEAEKEDPNQSDEIVVNGRTRTVAQEKEILKRHLDQMRERFETALARNEIFFFGRLHHRINGNYGTARQVMEVLPYALRDAQSAEDLQQRLQQGGVYFLDDKVVRQVYRNRVSYPILLERLRNMKMDEAIEASRRRRSRGIY